MRQYIIAALLICVACTACHSTKHGGKNSTLPGTWQAQPIVIDADSKDWPSPYPNYDGKAMIGYATSNDNKYLYVTMETGDEYAMMKILKAGMSVWVDTNGGKEASFVIHYPLPDDGGEAFDMDRGTKDRKGGVNTGGAGYDSRLRAQDFNAKAKRAVSSAAQMTMEGSPFCSGGFAVTQGNPCGVSVKIGIDEYKELIWEAAIPFKAIYGRDVLTKADAGRPISVCYAIKGFKKPKTVSESTGGSGMGGASGGMGGMQGGGRGGARGGKGSQGRMNGTDPKELLYETTKTYKYFGLAYQQ